jgi:signal transduction histidine kinase
MTLRIRIVLTSLLAAALAATGLYLAVQSLRARDRATTLDRIARSSMTQHAKDACEAYPNWFLAGPREAAPTREERNQPDADVHLPRPSTKELPLEFFAYNEQFEASSTAGPRFPVDFKRAMRATPPIESISGPFVTDAGPGVQLARFTGRSPGPCAVVLFRIRPVPYEQAEAVWLFSQLLAVSFAVALLVAFPVVRRVRQLAQVARESAAQEYASMARVTGHDEVSSIGAIFNEAAVDIRRRVADSKEREEALRRFVSNVTEEVAEPLGGLEDALGEINRDGSAPAAVADRLRAAVRDAHALTTRLLNLAVVVRLRTGRDRSLREPVDMNAIAAGVVTERAALARSEGVTITSALPDPPAVIDGDPVLFERAVANLVDNAILCNRPGGRVVVEIARYERRGRFSLRVTDTGRGVSDEEFAALTAVRRFRGDEGRVREPGAPGLGLAVAREIAERYGYQLELRRPPAGGFEAEIAGTGTA